MSWDLLAAILPAIVLFLYGIESFSGEVRRVAGKRFRTILLRATNTPLRGAIAGAAVTAIVQSSTATTIIAVGLVNAGTISFSGSLGLIFGANIGTTLTAQLVAFKLTAFAPFLILLGFITGIIRGPYRAFGKPIFYFGLVFFSLNLISSAVSPLQGDPEIISLLSITDSVLAAVLVGVVVTTIFQSSSVTAGLIVIIAQSGLLSLNDAIPLILGANIGTSTTALVVSLRMNAAAKRTAAAQFLFNFLGAALFLPLLVPFSDLIELVGGTPAQQVANAHLIFNFTCAALFLAAIKPFSDLIMKIVPQSDGEIVFTTLHLRAQMPEDINESETLVEKEIVHMLTICKEIFEKTIEVSSGRTDQCSRIAQLVDYVKYLNSHIIETTASISNRDISVEHAARIAILARVADLGVLMALQTASMARTFELIKERRAPMSPESYSGLKEMAEPCIDNMEHLIFAFPSMPDIIDNKMRYNDENLRQMLNWNYKTYLIRLAAKNSTSGGLFTEILFSIERIGAIIRELRKTTASMGITASAILIPDLIHPPDQSNVVAGSQDHRIS